MHHKDIAVAVIGAGFALAAVLVVFMGFLVAHAEALPSQAPTRLKERYIRAARWGIAPLSAAIVDALAAYGWLFFQTESLFYVWSIGFCGVAIIFLVYAVITVWMI
jgi:hypothetical protein